MCVQPMPLFFNTELRARSRALAELISGHVPPNRIVGVYVENSVNWVVLDLAFAEQGLISVPIPGFFTAEQKNHLLSSQAIRLIVTTPARAQGLDLAGWEMVALPGFEDLCVYQLNQQAPARFHPAWSGKLTFTSGSTGWPKPVALANEQLWAVAQSLAKVFESTQIKKHLCMLPLSILLENVAGVYTSFLLGAEVIFAPPERTGFFGSSRFDAQTAMQTIRELEAHSIIVLPEMLKALVEIGETAGLGSHQLKLVAVGGGKVAPDLILRAHAVGIPVYEGYGLSEAGSVVSVNCPGDQSAGSVGKPLSHVNVRIASDREIIVRTQAHDPITGEYVETDISSGDLGRLDSEGYLHVLGRKKNLLITGFGRNVSPEWPEATLTSFPAVAQAFVFGDGQPALSALLVPRRAEISDHALAQAVAQANEALPDYARIAAWQRCNTPFTVANGLLTPTGKPRREAILQWLANSRLSVEPLLPGELGDEFVLSRAC